MARKAGKRISLISWTSKSKTRIAAYEKYFYLFREDTMSEIVTAGTGAVGVSACAAVAGLALVAGYAAYKGLIWLTDQAKGEMERLEKEFAKPVSYSTTAQARKQFKKQFALFKAEAQRSPIL